MAQAGQTTASGSRTFPIGPASGVAHRMTLPVSCTLNHVGVFCWESTVANSNDLRAAVYNLAGDLLYETAIRVAAVAGVGAANVAAVTMAFAGSPPLPAGDVDVVVGATSDVNGSGIVVNGQNGTVGTPVSMFGPPSIHPNFPASNVGHVDAAAPRAWDVYLDYTELPDGMEAAAVGVASASATLSTQTRFAAVAADVASSSAALITAVRLAMSAVSNAAASGVLTSQIRLGANASGRASASAEFGAGAVLNASAADVASAVAALTIAVRLGGAAVDTAAATGALTNWASVTLSGTLYTGSGGVLDPNFWVDSEPGVGTTLHYDATNIDIFPNGEISSSTNNCTAVVQFFDGTDWALGLIVFTSQFAAVVRDSASASGQLTSAIRLAAAASALATATAAFSTGAGLTAAASDTADASGSFTTHIPLSALAADVAAAVGVLTTQIQLTASSVGVATAHGDLNGIIAMSAAAAALASAAAPLSTSIRASAHAGVEASADGELTTGTRMTAAAQDVAAAAGALSSAITLGASASDAVAASGDLTTARLLIAAAVDVATAAAVMSTGVNLAASAAGISRSSAELSGFIHLLADAAAASSATAELTDVITSPPIGVYVSDPRYVVARTRWSPCGVTPRFHCKHPDERAVLTFDLAGVLAQGETLEGPITLTIVATSGTDSNARDIAYSYPAYDAQKRRILLPVKGGTDGCVYYIKVSVATSNQYKVLAIAGLLPIRG